MSSVKFSEIDTMNDITMQTCKPLAVYLSDVGNYCYKVFKFQLYTPHSGGSKNLEKRGGASPSSFIANVHNDAYAFYTEKGGFKKI